MTSKHKTTLDLKVLESSDSSLLMMLSDILETKFSMDKTGKESVPAPNSESNRNAFTPFKFDFKINSQNSKPKDKKTKQQEKKDLRVHSRDVLSKLNQMCSIDTTLDTSYVLENIVKLCHNKSDSLESDLYELLGDGGIEIMIYSIENKEILCNVAVPIDSNLLKIGEELNEFDGLTLDGATPNISVLGHDHEQKIEDMPNLSNLSANQLKKLEKKQQKFLDEMVQYNMDNNIVSEPLSDDWMLDAGFSAEYIARERGLGLNGGAKPASSVDTWLNNLEKSGTREYHEQVGLPENTTRKRSKGMEEVHIPAPKRSELLKRTDDLVDISSFADSNCWVPSAFPGTKKLNRIQSTVYDTAFNTSENMLICAPTGAGKTNIAMLAYLQLVRQFIVSASVTEVAGKLSKRDKAAGKSGRDTNVAPLSGAVALDSPTDPTSEPVLESTVFPSSVEESVPSNFYANIASDSNAKNMRYSVEYENKEALKAVYIAPMKALAQEVVTKFGQRLKPLGLVVKEYTGDMQLSRQEVDEANLIVTTPEKVIE